MSGQHEARCGVLFADISDSTHLYDTYGDERAREIVLSCLDAVRDVVERGGGTVVDRIGDELMCRFPSAGETVRAAVGMQKAVDELGSRHDMPSEIAIRVGFHFGAVILDGDSLFGDTVYVAKRVSTIAKGEQIMTTGDTVVLLDAEWEGRTRFVDRTTLKGKKVEFDIHEVSWDDASQTVHTGAMKPITVRGTLTLEYGTETVTVDSERPVVSLGRGDRSDLVVDDEGVSRLHAQIEHRKGHFVLKDMSTNGTLLIDEQGAETALHRNEAWLSGSGTFRLGASENAAVRFECRTLLNQ